MTGDAAAPVLVTTIDVLMLAASMALVFALAMLLVVLESCSGVVAGDSLSGTGVPFLIL